MISLAAAFWIMVAFFAVIGTQRTWTREIVASLGLVLSLFIIDFFMPLLFGRLYGDNFDESIWRMQIIIMGSLHLFIAFISYAGPTITDRFGGRLKIRDNLQDKLMALLVGAVNGWLVVGTMWGLLNYRVVANGDWVPTDPAPYPFPFVVRPPAGEFDTLMSFLPIPFLVEGQYLLPVILVILLIFVLIVMI